ncbi:MAG: immunoglobulin domain-containing protein [Chitinispirillaceae bacterium]|nr:immunoglobulin domain-containing protein [Chitinispirillaceae bacterium]
MHKDFFASSLNVKWIGFIGLLYILTSLFCIDLPDPDNASNSGVKIILESSGGFISDQLIIDTVENDVKISVIHYFPSYIKSTALQIITNEGTMEWDTTLISNSREYSDTINVSRKIMTAGDKKVIATIFIEDNALRTDTVLLNVVNRASVTTGNIAPSWDISDTLTLNLTPGTQFSLKLNDTCFDQNGDLLAYTLLNGNLLQDTIIDFVYSYTAIAADTGTSVVKIIARDTGNLSDTLIIKLSVELPALSDAVLSSVKLSAGTLLQQDAPVPDTIRDTVSWIDSMITITPVSGDTLATILINEKKVISGTSSEAILLTEGGNSIRITVTSQDSASKVYTLIVIRKPNSTITLTSPPEGVAAAALSVSSIRILWNSLSGANSYTVQRSRSEAGTFETIGTTGSNSYIDTGLTAATPYFYHVNASNSASSTGYSTVVNATTLTKLTIRSQAQDTAVQVGSAVTITVEVTGSNPQFEWSKDNAVMTSQPGSGSLSLPAVTTGNAGVYSVKVRNESDSVVTTPIRLRVLPKTPAAPVVTVRSATSCTVSWSAVDGALWYKVVRSVNSGIFAGICSTAQISVIDTPLVSGGNYSYRVIAGNNDGMSDTSSAVSSTTWNPPVITTSPQSVTVPAGQTITLSVVATGDPACTYLWKKGDTSLEGKTESVLTIPQATTAHGGIYTVVVTNSAGSTEKSATVTVLPTYTLTITGPLPAGCSVTKQKDTAVYVAGATVTLTANAAANSGYRFKEWKGDTSATGTVLTLVMNKNRTITPVFQRQYILTLTSSDAAKGSVSSPSGSSPIAVDSGSAITINATPASRFKFKQWSVASGQVTIANTALASTTVQLSQGNATVQGDFGCITFEKKIEQPIVSGNVKVAQWDDDSYFIAGKQWNNGDLSTLAEIDKLDLNGNVVWAKAYGSNSLGNEFTSIRKTTDGFILACGGEYTFKLWKVVPNGTEIFWRRYNINGVPAFAQQTSDGGFIIGGENSEMFVPYIIKSDLSGNIIWADSSNFCESGYHIFDGQQTSDGGFVYIGADMPLNLFVVKKNSAGAVSWCKQIAGEFEGRTIRETSDGGFITASINSTKCVLIKLNASGNVVWKTENSSVERIVAVRQTSDGGFVYAGSTRLIGAGGYDFCLIKTNSAGTVAWTHTYGASGADETATSMEITNDGGFIIVGDCGTFEPVLYIVKTDENGLIE